MRHACIVVLALLAATGPARADIQTKTVAYEQGGVKLQGTIAWNDATPAKRPGVLVVHEWWGLDDYAKKRATMLAEAGYLAFAIDMFGEGKSTKHPKEAETMSSKVKENREAWRARALAGLEVLKKHDLCDPERLAAIGYCFGGATALELAWSGADLDAVVTFHGALTVPEKPANVKAKILICHGAADAFIPEESITQLRTTLDKAKIDYKFIAYPNAVHSFTVWDANERGMYGIAYFPEYDRQSWADMMSLFADVFRQK